MQSAWPQWHTHEGPQLPRTQQAPPPLAPTHCIRPAPPPATHTTGTAAVGLARSLLLLLLPSPTRLAHAPPAGALLVWRDPRP
jgi:hypothetical protein